jgi:hypothetical protein
MGEGEEKRKEQKQNHPISYYSAQDQERKKINEKK